MINLDIIAKELNIGKDKSEKDVEWYRRVVYSAVGRMALATLWNENDKGEISVRSLKRTTYELLKAYESIVPEINSTSNYGECTVMLCDSILSTMESAGFFYHRADYYRIEKTKNIKMGIVNFCRGIYATESCYMSGLGAYTKAANAEENEGTFLSLEKPQFVLQKLIESASWRECDFEKEKVEYLKMEEPFEKGYWTGQPNFQFQYSLARINERDAFLQTYYLVRNTSDGMKAAELPTWVSEDRNYTVLSTALLQYYQQMPHVIIKHGEEIAKIEIEYRLHPDVENLMLAYSWPQRYDGENRPFSRIIPKSLSGTFKKILVDTGYNVREDF
mgnify:CR=1 FL=1